jgi:hypothetical protein
MCKMALFGALYISDPFCYNHLAELQDLKNRPLRSSIFDPGDMQRLLGMPDHVRVVAWLWLGHVDALYDQPELQGIDGWNAYHWQTYFLPTAEESDLSRPSFQKLAQSLCRRACFCTISRLKKSTPWLREFRTLPPCRCSPTPGGKENREHGASVHHRR